MVYVVIRFGKITSVLNMFYHISIFMKNWIEKIQDFYSLVSQFYKWKVYEIWIVDYRFKCRSVLHYENHADRWRKVSHLSTKYSIVSFSQWEDLLLQCRSTRLQVIFHGRPDNQILNHSTWGLCMPRKGFMKSKIYHQPSPKSIPDWNDESPFHLVWSTWTLTSDKSYINHFIDGTFVGVTNCIQLLYKTVYSTML